MRGPFLSRPAALLLLSAFGPACTELRPLSERALVDADAGADAFVPADAGCALVGACDCVPSVQLLGLSVVAHGARLVLEGSCFLDAETVRVGGVEQSFVVVSDSRIEIASVSDASPVGIAQPIVVTSPTGTSPSVTRPVVHLVVDELDSSRDMGAERNQYVEVSTSVDAALDLSEYHLAFADGTDDGVHDAPTGVVLGTTSASGRYLIGSAMVIGTQATIANDALTASGQARAVVVMQGSTLPSPTATLASLPGPVIDALVYSAVSTTADSGLLAACFPEVANRVQVSEDANAAPKTESILRCGSARRDGRAFVVGTPAPGNPNACP